MWGRPSNSRDSKTTILLISPPPHQGLCFRERESQPDSSQTPERFRFVSDIQGCRRGLSSPRGLEATPIISRVVVVDGPVLLTVPLVVVVFVPCGHSLTTPCCCCPTPSPPRRRDLVAKAPEPRGTHTPFRCCFSYMRDVGGHLFRRRRRGRSRGRALRRGSHRRQRREWGSWRRRRRRRRQRCV